MSVSLAMTMMVCVLGMSIPAGDCRTEGLHVEDIFGRPLHEHGLTLVDWEVHTATPAIKIFIAPPPTARYPARAVVRARDPRLNFDSPSTIGPSGPRKEFRLDRPEKTPVFV